jgi:hypothetical protein
MEDIKLDHDVITLDNSILKGRGYNLYNGLLAQMSQFKESPVMVLQTDVVHNEAVKHLGVSIKEARYKIKNLLRTAGLRLRVQPDAIDSAEKLLSVDGSDAKIAEVWLEEYYESIGAEILYTGKYTDLSELLNMYFSNEAPFAADGNKKNEFPDAIALLALEKWASDNNKNIVAVSEDSDWMRYSEGSDRITVIRSLDDALQQFQSQNRVRSIIDGLREALLLENEDVIKAIRKKIEEGFDTAVIDIQALSPFKYEYNVNSIHYSNYELFCDSDDLLEIRVLGINDDAIVVKVRAEVMCEIEVGFKFMKDDPIDKDVVGENVYLKGKSYYTDIILTLRGDFSQGFEPIQVAEVEVLETIGHADFGEVGPDWWDQY